jgi:2-polyprenyl-3-methyl-5-hydroxy-6-metoxy-1,4-benzoquinol methylase
MKTTISEPLKRIVKKLMFPTPARLQNNQIQIDREGLNRIEQSIKKNYHTGWRSESCYSKEMYEYDLHAHRSGRVEIDRRTVVPWLDSARALRDMRVLEIGCGTASSTVAIAEQGAHVTGIDIDEGALAVAKDRLNVFGVQAECRILNANEMKDTFGANAFDMIIFFACLEHMTIAERITSLRDAWEMLPASGLMVIVETPNRLWFFDDHTSKLPFFHWLPDDLAFQYSRFSSRDNFCELYREENAESKDHFLRRGRGMSFHEVEMAICPAQNLNVISVYPHSKEFAIR